MRSSIDWNEIVPLLGEGLKQTLYLEAVRLLGESAEAYTKSQTREEKLKYQRKYYWKNKAKILSSRIKHKRGQKRDYAAEYARRKGKDVDPHRRHWTPAQRREIVAYYKEHGHGATLDKFTLASSVLNRWLKNEHFLKDDAK